MGMASTSPTPTGADHYAQTKETRLLYGMQLDEVRFARATGFVCDPWQEKFLRSWSLKRMLNCSRQAGKSTVIAIGATHKAIYSPGSLTLLLSRGERQSMELMRKVVQVLAKAPHAPGLISDSLTQLEFYNGSRILALPGNEATVRGFSAVDLLIADEASRIPDELFMAISPMLAVSGGELWTASTPFGTRGYWYEQYKQMQEDRKHGVRSEWDYYEVPATMCPRMSGAFLESEKRSMGEWWWRQEYFCEFLDAQTAAFGQAEIDAALEDEETIAWAI